MDLLDPELDLDGYREWNEAYDADALDSMTGVGKGYYDYVQAGQIEYDLMFGPEDSAFAFVDETYPDHIVWNAYFGAFCCFLTSQQYAYTLHHLPLVPDQAPSNRVWWYSLNKEKD